MAKLDISKAQVTVWVGSDNVDPVKATLMLARGTNGKIGSTRLKRTFHTMIFPGDENKCLCFDKIVIHQQETHSAVLQQMDLHRKLQYCRYYLDLESIKRNVKAKQEYEATLKKTEDSLATFDEKSKAIIAEYCRLIDEEPAVIVRNSKMSFDAACIQALQENKHVDLTISSAPAKKLSKTAVSVPADGLSNAILISMLEHTQFPALLKTLAKTGNRSLVRKLHKAAEAALKM